MIDVYFPLKGKAECVGGVSLKEMHPTMKINIWETYKVYPITDKIVLFQKNNNEFCTVNGVYNHEMGIITVKHINNEWLNVNVRENKK